MALTGGEDYELLFTASERIIDESKPLIGAELSGDRHRRDNRRDGRRFAGRGRQALSYRWSRMGPFSERGLESGTKDSGSGQARWRQEGPHRRDHLPPGEEGPHDCGHENAPDGQVSGPASTTRFTTASRSSPAWWISSPRGRSWRWWWRGRSRWKWCGS